MSFGVSKSRWRTPAFTLIELLVVVAIIALLLSILLPSLERARAQARQVMDLTNLNAQGKATRMYAEDNEGWIGRGLMGFPGRETNIYATTVLKYLGYPDDPRALWDGAGNAPSLVEQRRIRRALRNYGEQLQCPDYPTEAHKTIYPQNTPGGPPKTQWLDYIASAIPVPYTESMINSDVGGGGQGGPDSDSQGEPGADDYVDKGKLDDVSLVANPARIIYVTEANVSLAWNEFRYHHFFYTSQLPFGKFPRIANDQRHPGGITALFFDSHAVPLALSKVDPGWPNSLGIRLGLLTVVPEQYR